MAKGLDVRQNNVSQIFIIWNIRASFSLKVNFATSPGRAEDKAPGVKIVKILRILLKFVLTLKKSSLRPRPEMNIRFLSQNKGNAPSENLKEFWVPIDENSTYVKATVEGTFEGKATLKVSWITIGLKQILKFLNKIKFILSELIMAKKSLLMILLCKKPTMPKIGFLRIFALSRNV